MELDQWRSEIGAGNAGFFEDGFKLQEAKIEFLSVNGSVMLIESCQVKEQEKEAELLGLQTCILLSLMTLLCSVSRYRPWRKVLNP